MAALRPGRRLFKNHLPAARFDSVTSSPVNKLESSPPGEGPRPTQAASQGRSCKGPSSPGREDTPATLGPQGVAWPAGLPRKRALSTCAQPGRPGSVSPGASPEPVSPLRADAPPSNCHGITCLVPVSSEATCIQSGQSPLPQTQGDFLWAVICAPAQRTPSSPASSLWPRPHSPCSFSGAAVLLGLLPQPPPCPAPPLFFSGRVWYSF